MPTCDRKNAFTRLDCCSKHGSTEFMLYIGKTQKLGVIRRGRHCILCKQEPSYNYLYVSKHCLTMKTYLSPEPSLQIELLTACIF